MTNTVNNSRSKKLLSLFMASLMVLSLSVCAFATSDDEEEIDYVQIKHDEAVVRILDEIKAVKADIAAGDEAEAIKLSSAELKYIPWNIIDSVSGTDIVLDVLCADGSTYTVVGEDVARTPGNRVFYTFTDFKAVCAA